MDSSAVSLLASAHCLDACELGMILETASVSSRGVILMESGTIRRVTTETTIENMEDLWAVKRGLQHDFRDFIIDQRIKRPRSH